MNCENFHTCLLDALFDHNNGCQDKVIVELHQYSMGDVECSANEAIETHKRADTLVFSLGISNQELAQSYCQLLTLLLLSLLLILAKFGLTSR